VDFSKVGTLSNNDWTQSLVSFKKDDIHILAVGYGRDIKTWNLVSREVIWTLTGHCNYVYAMQVMENEENMYLISGSSDGTAKVWDFDRYSDVKSFECGVGGIEALQIFAKIDKNYVVVAGLNGVEVWCLAKVTKVTKLDEYSCGGLSVTNYNG